MIQVLVPIAVSTDLHTGGVAVDLDSVPEVAPRRVGKDLVVTAVRILPVILSRDDWGAASPKQGEDPGKGVDPR